MAELDPSGGRIDLGGGLVIQSANLEGSAELLASRSGGPTRDVEAAAPRSQLEAGLADLTEDGRPIVVTTHVVELRASQLRGSEGTPSRSVDDGTAVRLEVPAPAPGHEQAVLSVDENGITTWSFAPRGERGPAVRGGPPRTFVVPRPRAGGAREAGGGAARGPLDGVVRQIIKVVSFPIGAVVGKVASTFVEHWEGQHLQYGVRDYLPGNHDREIDYFNDNPARWDKLQKGRTLLMIHGTFSRAHGAFNELPVKTMQDLERLYDGRVIAFDHYTVSHSPKRNIEKLVSMMPKGTSIDLDIICHSRGGLVARSLTEWVGNFDDGRDIRVHRTALVGAVNNGTILADVEHWNDLIDMLSTLINTVGIGIPQPYALVLSFVQDIAEAGYPQLPGLYAMVPGKKFLKDLNNGSPRLSKYLAIASNYEPTNQKNLKSFLNDTIKDLLFDQRENDAMVRVDSVCGTGGSDEFKKVADSEILDDKQGIEHSRYFGNPRVAGRLVAWLAAGLP